MGKSSKDESICNFPKRIKFLGVKWDLSFVNDLITSNDHFAEISYNTHKIRIQNPQSGCELNNPMLDISFLHEIVHLLLHDMGYTELGTDEKFVDQLAHFLYAMQKDNKIFK